jgi:two-component system sensor histidine kinase SenX3
MRRRKTAIFFLVLGISLSALTIALNVGWILLSLREVAVLVLGIIFFALITTGLILNTIFLVREIKRSERHDAFLNAVTHELKTPIASIRLYLQTLKSREITEEKRGEFYDIMLADSDRLLRTVETVLQAGQMQERKREFNVTDIDINSVVADAVETVRSGYNLDEGDIKLVRSEKTLLVSADADELKTAFVNLLDNSVKYSGHDRKISVRIRPASLNNKVAIVVRDNGVGIPASDLKRVFKRFHRVANPGSEAKGTGLGLFIVKNIIERHGGKITADSRGVGEGATFSVHLPLSRYEDSGS